MYNDWSKLSQCFKSKIFIKNISTFIEFHALHIPETKNGFMQISVNVILAISFINIKIIQIL